MSYEIPEELYYTKTHEWIRIENEEVTMGISALAQEQLGDIVYVELPEIDADFDEGEALGVIESVKAASDFYAPVAGVVIEVNDALADAPETLNEDCYGDGWLIKMHPHDLKESMNNLMNAEQYRDFIQHHLDED